MCLTLYAIGLDACRKPSLTVTRRGMRPPEGVAAPLCHESPINAFVSPIAHG